MARALLLCSVTGNSAQVNQEYGLNAQVQQIYFEQTSTIQPCCRRHFGDAWVRTNSSSSAVATSRSKSCSRCPAGCAGIQRLGSNVGRLRERPGATIGLRLHNQAKLQRRFAGPKRPGTVRDRSKALQGGPRPREGRSCAGASTTWQKHSGCGA